MDLSSFILVKPEQVRCEQNWRRLRMDRWAGRPAGGLVVKTRELRPEIEAEKVNAKSASG